MTVFVLRWLNDGVQRDGSAILILDFCSHFEAENVQREAVLGQQNDDFDLQHRFNRENHSHTENCWRWVVRSPMDENPIWYALSSPHQH
ncbi:MAG: hypothetical protein AAGA75_24030 [Cyanobacteria bacterium P01_E01_bin.6]